MIPFLDTHVHFWDHRVDGLRWPWLEKGFTSHLHSWTTVTARERLEELHQRERFTVPEFKIEAADAGLCGIIHAHAATARDSASDETAWLDGVAASHGWPLAIIGRCDLASPDGPALLRRHREASARCTSVRDMNGPNGIDVDACEATLRVAAELGFAIELRTPPENFDMFVRFAECHPDVTFVMSHASLPVERSAASLATYRREAVRVAALPNWVCKVSALCGGSDPDWTVESIRPWAETCHDLFGPDRVMLGTNWPVDRLFGDYVAVVNAYRTIFSDLSDDEQHQLFHRNAARVYRVDDDVALAGSGRH